MKTKIKEKKTLCFKASDEKVQGFGINHKQSSLGFNAFNGSFDSVDGNSRI